MPFHFEISNESSDDTNGDKDYMNEEQTDDGNDNEEGDRCKDEEGNKSPEHDEDRKSQNVAALVGYSNQPGLEIRISLCSFHVYHVHFIQDHRVTLNT